MKTITLNLPDSVNEDDVKMQLAADLIGITKREFLENVGKHGVSIFGENAEDLEGIMNG